MVSKLVRAVVMSLFTISAAAVSASATEHPRLLFGPEDVPELRAKAGTPFGAFVVGRMKELLAVAEKEGFGYAKGKAPTYQEGFYAAGAGLVWVVTEDRRYLDLAAQFAEMARTQRRGEFGDWANMQRIAGLALAYDFCRDGWDEEFAARVRDQLVRDASPRGDGSRPDGMFEGGFTAASGLAALAVLGDMEEPSVAANLRTCADRADALMDHLGPLGWRNEFAGYESTMELLLPFLQCYRRVTGKDLRTGTHLANVPLLALLTDAQFYLNSDRGGYPERYAICHHYVGMGQGVAAEKIRPVLKWKLDQHAGPEAEDHVGNPFDACFVFVN